MRASVILLFLLLSGCSLHREPGIYPLAVETARARLRQADPGPLIAARGCFVRLDITVASQGAGALRWSIRGEGTELAAFAVRFQGAGDLQTRAIVDLATPASATPLAAPSGQPALRQPLQAAVLEFVDAALNGRAFDPARLDDSRSVAEACTTQVPAGRAEHANPWSSDWNPTRFGAPTASGEATLDATPSMEQGQEDRKEDLPKPDH
jgi:hypothetical protein